MPESAMPDDAGPDGVTPAGRPRQPYAPRGRRRLGTALVVPALLGWLGCLPVTVERVRGGTGGPYQALLAALVPWTLPVLLLAVVPAALAVALTRRVVPVSALALCAAMLALHGVWVAPSVLPDDADRSPSAAGPASVSGARPGTAVRVLAQNMLFGQADARAIVDVVRRERVDVLLAVLLAVELTSEAVQRLRAAGLDELLPTSVLAAEPYASGTGLWTRLPAQPLEPIAGTTFRNARVRITLAGGRTVDVSAVHPNPPLDEARWLADLRLTAESTRTTSGPQIIGGDFNATRDHAPFRAILDAGVADAADAAGLPGGAWPGLTWPADRAFPPVMRLDHVLFSPGTLTASDVSTVTVPGTDHGGVLATVALR